MYCIKFRKTVSNDTVFKIKIKTTTQDTGFNISVILYDCYQMTDERYEEMAMYKRQAIFTETRLKARSRQKLLSRVQNIVDSMHVSRTSNTTM